MPGPGCNQNSVTGTPPPAYPPSISILPLPSRIKIQLLTFVVKMPFCRPRRRQSCLGKALIFNRCVRPVEDTANRRSIRSRERLLFCDLIDSHPGLEYREQGDFFSSFLNEFWPTGSPSPFSDNERQRRIFSFRTILPTRTVDLSGEKVAASDHLSLRHWPD